MTKPEAEKLLRAMLGEDARFPEVNISDYLSDDGQALLLLCSQLGCEDGLDAPEPFKLSEWNQFAKKNPGLALQNPGRVNGAGGDCFGGGHGIAGK